LELLLPMVGREVNPVKANEEEESESDDDY
jgi:hypothetical protein